MKEQSPTKSTPQILKTDGGKTKSNAIEVPSISLPKGGGAIKGIDEKFSVNAVNGTASFSIPLPFSPARGAVPSLSLSYSSGAGNGIFGLGWNLSSGSIKRKTDKGLPQYDEVSDTDTFLFSEAEDLVPQFKKDGNGNFQVNPAGDYIIDEKDTPDHLYKVRNYIPRIEGLFARIERWMEKATGIIKWRVTTKENQTTLFGWTSDAVIANPANEAQIFEWLPEFVFDDKGNCSHYIYKKEDDAGFDHLSLHNKNRFINGKISYNNRYLQKIVYGNKVPYTAFGMPFPAEPDYFFSTILDYGSLQAGDTVDTIRNWDSRVDAFSDYKAGFEIRTTRLCKRVLLFHHFTGSGEYNGLVRSLNFEYDTSVNSFTFLRSVTSCGYIKKQDGAYTRKQLPATEFQYQAHEWNREIKTITAENLVHAPSGLDEQQYQFTDLFNEGLPGILTEQANGWYYKHNLGGGNFERAKLVSPKPSFAGLGGQLQLVDLDADGGKQLVSFGIEPRGYFELNDENEWQPFRNFQHLPNINFNDPNTKMLDLDGDGRAELLITEENIFTWYPCEGREGFSKARHAIKYFDEEKGPHILFADAAQSVFLADMSGDGLTDIVRIRNNEVCYWPNLGYGIFGAKVAMDNAPLFDMPGAFNTAYLKLADIDGSGTTDIIYLGKNKFTCWMNANGNAFSTMPFEINAFPEVHQQAKITVTDLLGNGVACIVWSSSLSKNNRAPLCYIDLMSGKKPHIMVFYKNNLGKEVSLQYAASTKFYIEDKQAGRPWVTKLHFPVHCVVSTETTDKISGWRFVSAYKYHHGYYDHAEREFRGFGMVEQTDTEDVEHWKKNSTATNIVDATLHQAPVLTKTWSHTGAFISREKILTQFAHEYWYEEMNRQGYPITHHETALPDARLVTAAGIPPGFTEKISAQEWREALRACKSMALRSEIFAIDAPAENATPGEIKKQLTPYTAATHNCIIELLQPKGKNRHAVFVVKESEAVTYSYERNTDDPRVAHTLNIKLDEYGNVLESASVVYPRRNADLSLPMAARQEQAKTVIIFTENRFTNDVKNNTAYRLRLPAEVKTFGLKGVSKAGALFTVADFENILAAANEVDYHQTEINPVTGSIQKRLIEHVRTLYYRNDLVTPLPASALESLALPYENYQLAYTPVLANDIYGGKVNDALLSMGKFTPVEGDGNWWIRSGITRFIKQGETTTDAQNRFFTPVSYTDPYGATTAVKYYRDYALFIEETEDALGNKNKVERFNFHTLAPQSMRDMNNNLSEALTDELGLVKAMAILGKGNEADDLSGLTAFTEPAETALVQDFFNATDSVVLRDKGKDLLKHATARFVYDFDVYKNTGRPAVVASIAREEHYKKNNDSPIQLSFEYSNGLGKVVMKKAQAEPGWAKKVTVSPGGSISITETDTSATTPKQLRWIGNGRTVLNNKGNPVKQYEPYFSVTHQYEEVKELVETGVTPVMYYDALSRLIRTDMPDGSFSKTEFDSWKQLIYDANDTVTKSAWYTKRMALPDNDPGKKAAIKAAKHDNTPAQMHLDTLGRPVLSVEHNRALLTGADKYYTTAVKVDAEGNLRSVTDARGNTVMQYKYDMLGNKVYQKSMDAGQRWLLLNILGNPLRTWDERNHEFQYEYDILHRPTQSLVKDGDQPAPLYHIFDRVVYGEALLLPGRTNESDIQDKNALGKPVQHFDTGGLMSTPDYDFRGQPVATTRQLFKKYKETANWTDSNILTDLETDRFTFTTETDALGRITKQTAPDGSIITPSYNEAGLLDGEKVQHAGTPAAVTYIKDIDYNEKGQRNKIIYGNDVTTKFEYDKETFRLTRLLSQKKNNDPLQDLYYTYDPSGNITHIEDKNILVVFFNNQAVTGISEYTYDALYRLVEASGRENTALPSFGQYDNWNDTAFMQQLAPGNAMTGRNYIQVYQYDSVGNIEKMEHAAANNNWIRDYKYESNNNRLKTTQVGVDVYKYAHHAAHGFITVMPHLEEIGWNFKEELVKSIRQKLTNGGTPETTYYQYDGEGQRIRKITENEAAAGDTPGLKDERIYIAGYEIYKKHSGASKGLERTSLSLLEKEHRFIMIETETKPKYFLGIPIGRTAPAQTIRYQLHNHLGSAAMELDDAAQIISYEEYHPFGTTAYQSMNADIKAAVKRYRYTGMERDEETGLEYHSARYYLSWLGRWLSADPIGIGDGVNVYGYCRGNPVQHTDERGTQSNEKPATVNQLKYEILNMDTPSNPKISFEAKKDNTSGLFRMGTSNVNSGQPNLFLGVSGPNIKSSPLNSIQLKNDTPFSLEFFGGQSSISSFQTKDEQSVHHLGVDLKTTKVNIYLVGTDVGIGPFHLTYSNGLTSTAGPFKTLLNQSDGALGISYSNKKMNVGISTYNDLFIFKSNKGPYAYTKNNDAGQTGGFEFNLSLRQQASVHKLSFGMQYVTGRPYDVQPHPTNPAGQYMKVEYPEFSRGDFYSKYSFNGKRFGIDATIGYDDPRRAQGIQNNVHTKIGSPYLPLQSKGTGMFGSISLRFKF